MKVTTLTPFSIDDRGFVANYLHERTGEHLIVFSKKGAVRGRHYHNGLSKTKNPEKLILASGTCEIQIKNLASGNTETFTITAPALIAIMPFEWHELKALSDCCFIEMNSLQEHIDDTFYE